MTILDWNYDQLLNKTHIKVDAGEFTEWYWVSGKSLPSHALMFIEPLIRSRLDEFRAGRVDTPHELENSFAGLL